MKTKNKKLIVVIIVMLVGALVVAAAVAVSVGVWHLKKGTHIQDKTGMVRDMSDTVISCSYNEGGGMDGGSMRMEISIKDDGAVWFDYYNCPYNGADEETISRKVTFDALEEIRTICKKRSVLTWGELPESELVLLDAPTTSITFIYGDNEFYSISSNKELPAKGEGIFSEIFNVLEKYKTQGDE